MISHKPALREAWFWGVAFIALGLPLSTVLMSVGQFVLAAAWLLSPNLRQRAKATFSRPENVMMMGLWAIHALWLFNSADLAYGWHDLQKKLPLLLIPLFLGAGSPLSVAEHGRVLWLFVVACVAGSLAGVADAFVFDGRGLTDRREMSLFVSHIRMSLMVCVAILVIGQQLVDNWRSWPLVQRATVLATGLWLFYYLVLIESFNGYLAFATLCATVGVWGIFNLNNPKWRWSWAAVVVSLGAASAVYLGNIAKLHYLDRGTDRSALPEWSASGALFSHYGDQIPQRENGYRVFDHVVMTELEAQWPKRSRIAISGSDKKGQPIRATLMRYLTSKGLTKDSIGVWQLAPTDIEAIERGITNYRFNKWWGVERRFDEALWEVDNYLYTGDPGNSSMLQRMVHAKVGWSVFLDNFWFGTGTGDVATEIKTHYAAHAQGLAEGFWARAHNQFITFLLAFGLFGGLLAIAFVVTPAWLNRHCLLYTGFWAVAMVSFFGDDTLETQAGATFYAFFGILLLGTQKKNPGTAMAGQGNDQT